MSLITQTTELPSFFPSSASAGLIGVATTPGSYSFTLNVTSNSLTTARVYNITVGNLTVRESQLPDAFVGTSYNFRMHVLKVTPVVAEVNAVFALNGGQSAPPGLTLHADGVLDGAPTTPGFYNFGFNVTFNGETTFHGRSVRVYAIGIPTNGALPLATQSQPYDIQITATGGSGPYTFTACPGNTIGQNCPPGLTALPTGLVLDASSGHISGTTTSSGKFTFTLTATDSNHVSYSKVMDLRVIRPPSSLPAVGLYSGGRLDDTPLGWGTSQGLFSNSGVPPFIWTASNLPPGTTLVTGDGNTSTYITPNDAEISGTPLQTGMYNVTVTVTDSAGASASNTFPFRVSPLNLRDYLPNGTINVPYSSKLRVVGGNPPYSIVQTGGRLPAGLSLNAPQLRVAGTPLEDSPFNFSFDPLWKFTDQSGNIFEHRTYFGISGGASTISISTGNNLGTRAANAFTSITFTACCVPSFTWSHVGGALPPGMSLTPDGILSGTPTTNGVYKFLIQAADAANLTNVGVREFTLVITSLAVTAVATPIGNLSTQYSLQFTATGGTGSYLFSVAQFNYLPPGLQLDGTGLLHGTPTSTGSYFFTIQVDDGQFQVTRGFTINVYGLNQNPPLNLNIGPIIGPRLVGALTQQLTTTGGTPPYSYSLTPGFADIPGMRVQSGQPLPTFFTETGGYLGVLPTPGTFQTSIRVTDSSIPAQHFDRPITIIVWGVHQIAQTTLPRLALDVPMSFQIDPFPSNGVYTWALSNSALPPNLSLSPSGMISGTPKATGTFNFTVLLTDVVTNQFASVGYSVTVDPFAITTGGVLPSGVVGTPYSRTLSAPGCGAGCTWTTTTGFSGLTLTTDAATGNGVLSGTPTGTFNGSFTAVATGASGTARKQFSLLIAANTPQPLFINTTTLGPVTVGNTTASSLTVSGGTQPYTWTLDSGSLPPGLALYASGEQIGSLLAPGLAYLAGRVMQAGSYDFTLKVTDAANTVVTRAFTFHVSRLSNQYGSLPPSVNPPFTPLVYATSYTQPLLVIGGSGQYAWTNTGPMFPGLAVNGGTGVVTGTPTNTGTVSVPMRVVDAADATSFTTFNLSVTVAGPTATTLGFSSGPNLGITQLGFSNTFTVTPTGGTPPYTVSALSPMPAGFKLLSGDSLLSGFASNAWLLSGQPLETGPQSFTLHAQDSVGNIGVRTFTLTVSPFTRFTGNALQDATAGTFFTQSILTWDNTGTPAWSITPGSALPPGLNLSNAGVISGTPTVAGNYAFTLSATDESGVVINFGFNQRVSPIAISDPGVLPDPRQLPDAISGQPYAFTFAATGAGASPVWSATGLPNGLTMSPGGVISGTTTATGSFSPLITVTSGGVPFTKRFALFGRLPIPTQLDFNLVNTALADMVVGQSTALALAPTGGSPPYTWVPAAGSTLPPGLQLMVANTTNLLNFVPGSTAIVGAPSVAGLYQFDLVVTDAHGASTRRTFTVNVSPMNIISGTPRTATVNTAFSQQFLAAGGTGGYVFSIEAISLTQEPLPPGLSLNDAGLLSGTPTSTGNYTFRLKARDSAGHTFARTNTLTVNNLDGWRVNGANPADGWPGRGRAPLTLTASLATPVNWSIVGGNPPPGMGLMQSAGSTVLGGAPTIPGIYTFIVRGTDANNPASTADHAFTYRVAPMQVITPTFGAVLLTDLPSGEVNTPYSFRFKLVGGAPPLTFTVSPFNPLPAGLALSSDGVISGTPQQPGNHTIQVIVSDSAEAVLNVPGVPLVITPAGVAPPLLTLINGSAPNASVGAPFVFARGEGALSGLTRGGRPPYSFVVSPAASLPPGITLSNAGNGFSTVITGIPTTPGDYNFAFDLSDSSGQMVTQTLNQHISVLSLTPEAVAPMHVATPVSITLQPSGGVGPYLIQVTPTSDMPPGLSISNAGAISGTPTAAGIFLVTLSVTDTFNNTLTAQYPMVVDNAAGQSPGLSLSPKPLQVLYEIGSPAPSIPVGVGTTSGPLAFQAIATGIPGMTLSSANGTATSNVMLNFDVTGLGAGRYAGAMAVKSIDAANRFDVTPVTLTVSTPPPCIFGLRDNANSVPAIGGAGSFNVDTAPNCTWNVTLPPGNVVRLNGVPSGKGPGLVSYNVVSVNTTLNPRTFNIGVGGQQHTITQFGSGCTFAIAPTKLSAPASGGVATIKVTPSTIACGAWTAIPEVPGGGLDLLPAGGTGADGEVNVLATIQANTDGSPRTLKATIAGKLLTITQAGAACNVGLSPFGASILAGGGSGSIEITTPSGCSYDTTSKPSWVHVTSGESGNASSTLVYSVDANSTTVPRTGTMMIGGQVFQVTQDAQNCSVSIDTSGLGSPFAVGGGTGSVVVTTNGANCGWAASSNVPWASVVPLGGAGTGSVGVTVQSNAGSSSERLGQLTVAGQVVPIKQSGTVCTFVLRSTEGSVPAAGGGGSVGVVAPAACAWGASSDSPLWLTIASAGSAGSADVQFLAQPNAAATKRTATLTIAGLSYDVTQAAAPCSYTLNPTNITVASGGASDAFAISSTTGGCAPNAVSYASWITATTSFSGNAGSVSYTVELNPSTATRIGTIRVGEQNFTVTQTGGACGFSLNSYSTLIGPAGDTQSFLASQSAIGCAPVPGTDQPSFIFLGPVSGPVGNIFTQPFTLPPFAPIMPAVRLGHITFGGQIFVVKQTSY
jgi:hypothetical protein